MIEITEEMRSQVRASIGSSLSSGLGTAEHHCVMAAVSLAIGEGLSDTPSCVHAVDRKFAITINDAQWSSDQARAAAMLPLALASLGTAGIDRREWVRRVVEGTIRRIVPMALRSAVRAAPSHAMQLEAAAVRCEHEGTEASARVAATDAAYATDAATAYAAYAAYAAVAAYATVAADYAANAADAAAHVAAYATVAADYAAYAATDAAAAARDAVLLVAIDVAIDAYK